MTVQTAAFLVGSLTTDSVRLIAVPVVVAAVTSAAALTISRSGEAANRRRDQYAQAVQTLVAWIEFPYRVRRRTDDNPGTLSSLAELGHDIQERLACHQAWIATEHPPVATSYSKTRQKLGPIVGAAIREAWNAPPTSTAAQMNLGEWGPGATCAPAIAAFQNEVELRFGLRRVATWLKP
jgi:hypothetical protein